MRYVMQQKLLSWGDDYVIRDERGDDRYFVDGKAFSIGASLSLQDMSGNELAFIKQRVLTIGPTYEIHRGGALAAVVTRKLLSFLHHRFVIDVPGPNDLEAEGNLLDHEYTFRRGEDTVATVTKTWMTLRDTYGIDIASGEDDVLILASAVVIDEACHPDDQGHG